MRYIGGKSQMTKYIMEVIQQYTHNVETITDIFSGSGVVARTLKAAGYGTIANDLLYFSYALNKGILCNNETTSHIRDLLSYLNNLPTDKADPCNPVNFIAFNYAPNPHTQRMYLQQQNALKIDVIRQEIERIKGDLTENEYFYLLASLVSAVPYVSNITGTYAAYLKYWDARTFKTLTLQELPLVILSQQCEVYNEDALELIQHTQADIVYLDPPYNTREYLPNYHLLETIARYDYPEIKGVTGMRATNQTKSDFCKKAKVYGAFKNILTNAQCKYILLSYNNEGLLPTEEIVLLMQDCGVKESFRLFEYDYRRYKSKIPNNAEGLKEQLYFIQKY